MLTFAEVRNAARSLSRAPAVSISAVVCLALGIGATAAISSAVSRALFDPLPFRDTDRLVAVHRTTPQSGPQGTWPESPSNYLELAAMPGQVRELSALNSNSALINLASEALQLASVDVTGGLFSMLGTSAQRGRLIGVDDDTPGAPAVAMFSDDFWRSKLGADSTVVGKTFPIDGVPTSIVGILPPDFRIPHGGNLIRADVWRPMRWTSKQRATRSNFVQMLGRLAPGATVASANADVRLQFARLLSERPDLKSENLRAASLAAENVETIRRPLLLLFGAVCMVLLIAATNVAALLLARGVQRRREVAVRVALGATRWQTMRQALVESFMITGVGAALGIGVAVGAVKTIGALAAARMPQLAGLTVDLRVLGAALVLAVFVALVCGAAPAWSSARVDPQDAMRGGRGGGMGREHNRALRSLVVVEISLSVVLLIGAGLELKAFASLIEKSPGFDPTHILTMRVTTSAARYPKDATVRDMLEPMLGAIRTVPGVVNAAAINTMPYQSWGNNSNIRYEGMSADNPSNQPLVEQRTVSPEFFATSGQHLISGRLLLPSDDETPSAPQVTVVNAALMKRDFAGKDPVGKRFYISDTSFATIVGVVSDIRNAGPVADPAPEMYWTYRQSQPGAAVLPLMIHVTGNPTSVVAGVRAAIRSVDQSAAISGVAPMNDVIVTSLGRPRFYLSLLGSFAVVAIILAVAGLYGVLSYAVAQRTREIGIRSALGSPRTAIIRMVTFDGLRLVAAGLVVGLAVGAGVTRLMGSMLYQVSPLDPVSWLAAALLMVVAGLAASILPARRASRVNPIVAIQTE